LCHLDIVCHHPTPQTVANKEEELHSRLLPIGQAGGYNKVAAYLPKVPPGGAVHHMVVHQEINPELI
jgi:hypothetical protein